MFSDGTPPLFYQAPHIVDQSGQVILVDDYPLLFHAVFETGGIEALVCLHVVQSLAAVFEPDRLIVSVFVFVAGRPHSRGEVVKQNNQVFGFHETRRVYVPNFLDWPKTSAHGSTSFSSLLFSHKPAARRIDSGVCKKTTWVVSVFNSRSRVDGEWETGMSAELFFGRALKSARTREGGRYRPHRQPAMHQYSAAESRRRAPDPRRPR